MSPPEATGDCPDHPGCGLRPYIRTSEMGGEMRCCAICHRPLPVLRAAPTGSGTTASAPHRGTPTDGWTNAQLQLRAAIEQGDIEINRLRDVLRLLAEMVLNNDERARTIADEVFNGTVSARMHDIRIEDGSMAIAGSHWSTILIARSMGKLLLKPDGGHHNYIESQFTSRDGQRVVLTIQHCEGKTPHQLRLEAEAERDTFRVERDGARAKAALCARAKHVAIAKVVQLTAELEEARAAAKPWR